MTDAEGRESPVEPANPAKAADWPHAEVVPDNDARLEEWLGSMTPAERAHWEERIAASAAEDLGATAARQADRRVAAALGVDPDRTAQLRDALAERPAYDGLVFQALRHPLDAGTHTTRGMLLTTTEASLALVRPGRGGRAGGRTPGADRPHRVLAVASRTGRPAVGLAVRPAEHPVVFLPGTRLRVLAARDLGSADVVLAVDETDPAATGSVPDDALWRRAATALAEAGAPPADADPASYLAGSLP